MRHDCHISSIIAHRGASGYAPENTLAAFRKAKELGADWVEFDVKLTKCGMPIVIHDETLDRTTNGQGLVAEHTYDEIKNLDAGSWFDQSFTGEKVPSLIDVISCLTEHDLQANLEFKPCPNREIETAKTTIQTLRHHWPQHKSKPLLSCFNLDILCQIHEIAPEFPLAWLVNDPSNYQLSIAHEIPLVSINCNQATLTTEIIEKILQTDVKVLSYTVNDIQRAKDLFRWGISAIFTSYPDKLIEACNSLTYQTSALLYQADN